MDEQVKTPGTRRYHSPLRQERARANREAILRAAHERFLAEGYPRTTIAAVARDAGVSPDLVYRLFESKRRLLVEVLNFAVTGDADSPAVLDQPGPQAVRAETDQRRQVALFAEDIAMRTARARPVDDVFLSAGAVDPEIAAKHTAMHRTRLRNLAAFTEWLAGNGPLRPGLDVEEAAATAWVLTGPVVHRLLGDELGWDQERYAAWVRRTVAAALLEDR